MSDNDLADPITTAVIGAIRDDDLVAGSALSEDARKHAIFVSEEDGYVVRDAGSLNGTYVNRERVDSIQLKTGDSVQIGKYRMVYYASRRDS